MKNIKNLKNPKKSLLKITTINIGIAVMLVSSQAYADKPYVSELPETIGQGKHQLEYSVDYNRPRHMPAGFDEVSVTTHNLRYVHGITPNIDLAINLPFDTLYIKPSNRFGVKENSTKIQDLEIYGTANYYKNPTIDAALQLTLSLPTGDENDINGSTSYGKANVSLKALNQLKINEKLSLHNNLEFSTKNRKDEKNTSIVGATIGATYKVTPQFSTVVDAGYAVNTRTSDENARFLALGAAYATDLTKAGFGFKISRSGNDIEHSYNFGIQQGF